MRTRESGGSEKSGVQGSPTHSPLLLSASDIRLRRGAVRAGVKTIFLLTQFCWVSRLAATTQLTHTTMQP